MLVIFLPFFLGERKKQLNFTFFNEIYIIIFFLVQEKDLLLGSIMSFLDESQSALKKSLREILVKYRWILKNDFVRFN